MCVCVCVVGFGMGRSRRAMLNGTKLIKRRDIRPTEPVNMKGALLKDSSLTFFFFFFFLRICSCFVWVTNCCYNFYC